MSAFDRAKGRADKILTRARDRAIQKADAERLTRLERHIKRAERLTLYQFAGAGKVKPLGANTPIRARGVQSNVGLGAGDRIQYDQTTGLVGATPRDWQSAEHNLTNQINQTSESLTKDIRQILNQLGIQYGNGDPNPSVKARHDLDSYFDLGSGTLFRWDTVNPTPQWAPVSQVYQGVFLEPTAEVFIDGAIAINSQGAWTGTVPDLWVPLGGNGIIYTYGDPSENDTLVPALGQLVYDRRMNRLLIGTETGWRPAGAYTHTSATDHATRKYYTGDARQDDDGTIWVLHQSGWVRQYICEECFEDDGDPNTPPPPLPPTPPPTPDDGPGGDWINPPTTPPVEPEPGQTGWKVIITERGYTTAACSSLTTIVQTMTVGMGTLPPYSASLGNSVPEFASCPEGGRQGYVVTALGGATILSKPTSVVVSVTTDYAPSFD
jgi:hypothetical protein